MLQAAFVACNIISSFPLRPRVCSGPCKTPVGRRTSAFEVLRQLLSAPFEPAPWYEGPFCTSSEILALGPVGCFVSSRVCRMRCTRVSFLPRLLGPGGGVAGTGMPPVRPSPASKSGKAGPGAHVGGRCFRVSGLPAVFVPALVADPDPRGASLYRAVAHGHPRTQIPPQLGHGPPVRLGGISGTGRGSVAGLLFGAGSAA